MTRTRIKICGLTRIEDVNAAVAAGADAVGFVCYEGSRRYVPPDSLEPLSAALPALVTPVLLFVNATAAAVEAALLRVPNALLQFHGDERPSDCERFRRPYIRAIGMTREMDLLDCERSFGSARALLVDAPSAGFGGAGATFDWELLPSAASRTKALILAGGLNETNVTKAIHLVHPFAVDVSSGVEDAPGVKSAERIRRFVDAVRTADASAGQA
ncbi:MAG: phosphoribosylanthranilate isomerase [Gemmatimonadota bacterium]